MSAIHSEQITKWLRSTRAPRGTIVRGVRFEDGSFISDVDTKDYPALALEQGWRVVSDTFQVLAAQRIPPTRLSWTYEKAVLHCVRRHDGVILGILVMRKSADLDTPGMNKMLADFLSME